MITLPLESAIVYLAENSPELPLTAGSGGKFFIWAEDMTGLLSHIYMEDYDSVLEQLVDACKAVHGYSEDSEDDED